MLDKQNTYTGWQNTEFKKVAAFLLLLLHWGGVGWAGLGAGAGTGGGGGGWRPGPADLLPRIQSCQKLSPFSVEAGRNIDLHVSTADSSSALVGSAFPLHSTSFFVQSSPNII